MKPGWQMKKIGEICRLMTGGTPNTKTTEYYGGDIKWLVSGDIHKGEIFDCQGRITEEGLNNSNAKFLPLNSVIIALNGQGKTRGTVALLRTKATCNQSLVSISPTNSNQLLPEFLYFYLHSRYQELRSLTGDGGNDRRGLNMPLIREIEISIPPMSEQKRIVAILDEAFANIAIAKANAEKNLQNARELFESYIKKVFESAWQKCPLTKLSDLATDITDGDHMPPPKAETGIPFITIGNINKKSMSIDFSDTFMVPRSYYEGLKENRKPKAGDVLYTVTGSFGIPVLVKSDLEFCFQRHIGLVRPKSENSSNWIFYLLMSPQVFSQAKDGATGTAQKTVSLGVLRNFWVPRQTLSNQKKAAALLDLWAKDIKKLEAIYEQKIAALDELKKALLHKAFSGEL